MHTVIYRFEVKENEVEKFVTAWLGLTKLIYEYEGSLGSRIHKVKELEYIAYAQWPSKLIYDNAGSNLPSETDVHRKHMKESCNLIETLYEMEVVEDYLQSKPKNK